jgi:hypothetical protein
VLQPQPLVAETDGRHWSVAYGKNEPEQALGPGVQRSDPGGVSAAPVEEGWLRYPGS